MAEVLNYAINLDEYTDLNPDGRGLLYASVFKTTDNASITLYGPNRDRDAAIRSLRFRMYCWYGKISPFGRTGEYNDQIEVGWVSEMYDDFINEKMTIDMVKMLMIELLQLAHIDPDVTARIGRERCENWVSQFVDILLQFDDSRDVLDV